MPAVVSPPINLHPLRAHPVDPNEIIPRRSPSQISEKQPSESKINLKTADAGKKIIARITIPLSEFAKDCVRLEEKVIQGILSGNKKRKTSEKQTRKRNQRPKPGFSIIRISAEPGEKKDACIIVHKELPPPPPRPTKSVKHHRVRHIHGHIRVSPAALKESEKPSQKSDVDMPQSDSYLEKESIKVVDFAYRINLKKSSPVKVVEISKW